MFMAAFGAVLHGYSASSTRPSSPSRLIVRHRVRLSPRLSSGCNQRDRVSGRLLPDLGLLPSAFAYPQTEYPVSLWAHRADLSQFLGSFLYPPLPSPVTWWIGFAALGGLLTTSAWSYAVLLAWALADFQPRPKVSGSASGFVFRSRLQLDHSQMASSGNDAKYVPDTGLFLIGWSSWATLQLLVLCLFMAASECLYERFTAK